MKKEPKLFNVKNMKIGKAQETTYKKPERLFSISELEKFHQDIQIFRVEKKLDNDKDISFIDFKELHKVKKTVNKIGGIYLEDDGFGGYITPTRYERLENKIAQYINWRGKKDYIENKELEGLDKLSNKVKITDEIDVNDIPF